MVDNIDMVDNLSMVDSTDMVNSGEQQRHRAYSGNMDQIAVSWFPWILIGPN